MLPHGYPQDYCQELQTTRVSFLTKLCVSFCFGHDSTFTSERVPIKPHWTGNEETVLSLIPCSENFRMKGQVLLGRWFKALVFWVFSFRVWSKTPHLSTACVARNFKEFCVRIHQPEIIKIPGNFWQPWPEHTSRMQKKWLTLHELRVLLATWNIATAARKKLILPFFFLIFFFQIFFSPFKEEIIFGDFPNV